MSAAPAVVLLYVPLPHAHPFRYTNLNIPPHTDGTYYEDVPGLQIFHCISGSYSGGLTSLIDGFAVAERMRAQHPDAFAVLCSVRLPFRYIGDGYHLSNRTHVFTLDDTGRVVQFRYNNCDRAPLDAATLVPVLQAAAPPIADAITYERVYDALQRLHELLDDSSMQVQFKLAPGKVMRSQRAHVFAFVSLFRIHCIS